MARTKEFNIDDALMKAIELFWRRGYEATSLQNLVDYMGISRASLYATFGSKHDLFLKALRRYDQKFREEMVADMLQSAASPRQAIIKTFEAAITAVLEGGSRDGCLLINTALELSPHDSESEEIVKRAFVAMEGFFRLMIEQGQAEGEIPETISPTDTARGLLGLFIGLRVLARSRPEPSLLRSIASQAEAMLK